MNYYSKYLKYKNKYLNLKNEMISGSSKTELSNKYFNNDVIKTDFNIPKKTNIYKSFYKNGNDSEGIIFGHGSSIPKVFCIVPDNIIIRPTTKLGNVSNRASFLQDLDDLNNLYSKKHRRYITFEKGYNTTYYPSSLIQDMLITFKSTYPETSTFSFSGIVTGNINKSDEFIRLLNSVEDVSNESLKYHDTDIILDKDYQNNPTNGNIWGKSFYLSDILKAISTRITENNDKPYIYTLQICRSGIDITTIPDNFCNNYLNIPDPVIKGPITLLRQKTAEEIDGFKYFNYKFKKIKKLLGMTGSPRSNNFILEYLNGTNFICKSDISCIGPVFNCDSCTKTCNKITKYITSIIGKIEETEINNNRLSYESFCLISSLLDMKIPFNNIFNNLSCD